MPRQPSPLLVLCLLLTATLPAAGRADVALVTRTEHIAEPGLGTRYAKIWLDDVRIRLEFSHTGSAPDTAVVIFRADRDLYWAIDATSRSYVQIDREEMLELGRRVREASREMAADLDGLPPDERAAVERMLADMQPAAEPRTRERLVPSDETRQIEGRTARLRRLVLGEAVVGEVWVSDWAAVGIEQDELRVFEKLAAFQRALIDALGSTAGASFGSEPFEIFDRLDGYPLLIRRLHEAAVESETHFGLPGRVAADDARYQLPESYLRRPGPGHGEPSEAPDTKQR